MGVDVEMRVHTPETLDALSVRKLAGDISAGFFREFFWLVRDEDQHALSIVADDDEDDWHDCADRPDGGTLITVSTLSRYYGEGYERGHWPIISGVMRWLRARLPQATIWYGGDSGGTLAVFTEADDSKMWAHFIAVGHDPYHGTGTRDSFCGESAPFCDFCQRRKWNNGGFASVSFWMCDGCGETNAPRIGGAP